MSDNSFSLQEVYTLRDKVVLPALEAVLSQEGHRPIPRVPWHEVSIHLETFAEPLEAYGLLVELLNKDLGLTPDRLDYIQDFVWEKQWNVGNHAVPWSTHPSLANFHNTPGTIGMYFHESNLIWVRAQVHKKLQETLAHEFVHVFQYQAYPNFARALSESIKDSTKHCLEYGRWLKMLSEGHASVVAREVCKKIGVIPELVYESEERAVTSMGSGEVLFFFSYPEVLLCPGVAERKLNVMVPNLKQ